MNISGQLTIIKKADKKSVTVKISTKKEENDTTIWSSVYISANVPKDKQSLFEKEGIYKVSVKDGFVNADSYLQEGEEKRRNLLKAFLKDFEILEYKELPKKLTDNANKSSNATSESTSNEADDIFASFDGDDLPF